MVDCLASVCHGALRRGRMQLGAETSLSLSRLALVCYVLLAGIGDAAFGQTCYRVTKVKDLEFTLTDDLGSPGINSLGEVVFTAKVGTARHAFVWLPAARYGLPAQTAVDLHITGDVESAAHDINDAGYVAGEVTRNVGGVVARRAFVWKLSTGATFDLSQFPMPSNYTRAAVAWAIDNSSPPVAAGQGAGLWQCFCPPSQELLPATLGFHVAVAAGETIVVLPPRTTAPCDQNSVVRDLPPQLGAATAPPQFVGYSWEGLAGCAGPGGCVIQNQADAAAWSPIKTLADFGALESEAFGTNDALQIVGHGWEPPFTGCQQRALFWEDRDAPYCNLGGLMPPGQGGDQSHAEAINNLALPQVAGWNEDDDLGLLWNRVGTGACTSANWTPVDLTSVVPPCKAEWPGVVRAFDVNNNGWIIAVADRIPGSEVDLHAVLLTPYACCVTCDADLIGHAGGPPDCDVGTPDFLELLNRWGSCPAIPSPCRADLDCDGTVGNADFQELLAKWGACPAPCTPCGGGSGAAYGAGGASSSAVLKAALALMGFQGVVAYQQWLSQASDQEAFDSAQTLGGLLVLLGG